MNKGLTSDINSVGIRNRKKQLNNIKKQLVINRNLYIMLTPVILYYLIFQYLPMLGLITAFQDYSPAPTKGFFHSPWVGVKHFEDFFTSPYFYKNLRNTIILSLYGILFMFPTPIILALLLNELKNKMFKRIVQTVTYFPHFISLVVVVGFIATFFSSRGVITNILKMLGLGTKYYLIDPSYFRALYIGSGIWQEVGWGSIIYLAALSSIDIGLYEAAIIDGAGRFKRMMHITIPGIIPTVVVMLVLRIGKVMSVGFEKIILMYNPAVYETADVINTYVYRRGMLDGNYSYASAVGLFNSVVNFCLVIVANKFANKSVKIGLW